MKETEAIEMQHVLHDELPPDLVPAGRDRDVPRRPTTDRMELGATTRVMLKGRVEEIDVTVGFVGNVEPSTHAKTTTTHASHEDEDDPLCAAPQPCGNSGDITKRLASVYVASCRAQLETGGIGKVEIALGAVLAEQAKELTQTRPDIGALETGLQTVQYERDAALAEVERLKAELARAHAAPGGLSEEAIAKVNAAFRGEKPPTSQCPAHEPGGCSICR